jgi:serine/threonine protein kinase
MLFGRTPFISGEQVAAWDGNHSFLFYGEVAERNPDACNLIAECLQPDSAKRPSAFEVMQHVWFTKPRTNGRNERRENIIAASPPLDFFDDPEGSASCE